MDQVRKNKIELVETIEKYGEMPITPERAAFLANCWAAHNALCMICGDDGMRLEERRAHAEDHAALTKEVAVEWTRRMKNEDGTAGPHWTMEQTEQVRKQKGIECDPLEFYVAMNMMYSDYCKVAEKFSASTPDFYAYMAKAFLDDKDAADGKISRYYSCVVKH